MPEREESRGRWEWLRGVSWAERGRNGEKTRRAVLVFFFQAEDGIRDLYVTGVQTCALPISCLRVPGVLCFRPISQKISAPTNIAKVDSGGSTTPRPTDTAESGKRPLVATRASSIAMATATATPIVISAEVGNPPTPLEMISATPFHCSAAGMANWSEMIVAVERMPFASGRRKSRK